jgi:eight-cysteine-cluster-containing protein
MKATIKKIVILLIVAIILGAAILAGALNWKKSEKTDETGNWQTYQSSRGFSIKCPVNFDGYSDVPNDTTAYQDGLKSGCLAKDNGAGTIEIISWTKFTEEIWGKNFTFDDFLKNEIEIIKKSDADFNQEEIFLDENPAVKIAYTENLGANEIRKVISVYSKKNKAMYHIRAVINFAEEKEFLPIVEKIISNFDFIDSDLAGNFCGISTLGECSSDSDCVTGGCSSEICQSKNEEPIITTCEYKACYKAIDYGLECGCSTKKCQWKPLKN